MSDIEKFYKLAENIVNYPYEKAVYSWKGKITEIRVFSSYNFRNDIITLHKHSDGYEIVSILNDNVCSVSTLGFDYFINYVIDEIKHKVINEGFKKALLEGIE